MFLFAYWATHKLLELIISSLKYLLPKSLLVYNPVGYPADFIVLINVFAISVANSLVTVTPCFSA